jgi:putative aldouronate transport system permease protein
MNEARIAAADRQAAKRMSLASVASKGRRGEQRRDLTLLLMGLPALVQILVFAYLPMFGLVIAFKDYRFSEGIFGSSWVGLENFRYLFARGTAWRITYNTIVLNGIFITSTLIVSVTVAILMNEIYRSVLARFYQTALFLPHFVSWVIAGYFVFGFLSANPPGWVNRILDGLGMEPIRWYQSPQYWPGILTIVNLWKSIGFWSIVYLAGILGISPEYYEAAKIDGATKLQQIVYVTLPLLVPLIVTNVLLQVGRIFYADFGLFFNVTQDQPALYRTTDVIDTFVYRSLRQLSNVSMAAAAGFYQAVVGLVLISLVNWIVRRINPERALF